MKGLMLIMTFAKKYLIKDFMDMCNKMLKALNSDIQISVDKESNEYEAYACNIDGKHHIIISAELLFKIRDMDIMRAIVAHEISHINLHHTDHWGGDIIYSFQHELYADVMAIKLLNELGYGYSIYIQMLNTLLKLFGERYSNTHPLIRNRIEFCEMEIKNHYSTLKIINR